MSGFLDRLRRLFRRRDIFDELEEIQAAIDRGEDVSDRVVYTEQRQVDRSVFANVAGRLARRAYIPRTTEGDFGAGSGFGGLPWLTPGVDHPVCPNCRRALPLLAQLSIDTLPDDARPRGDGLIQAFYCDGDCEVALDGWSPFSGASLVRLVPSGPGAPSPADRQHPSHRVDAWDAREEDLPTWDEAAENGIEYPEEYADDDVELALGRDKLGGWPAWVQAVEYPDCPRCGNQMVYVLQIDSEDHVPIMFGDLGTGHVTQCRQHPDVLAFGWAAS